MWYYPTVIGKVPPGQRTGKPAGFEFCIQTGNPGNER